MNIVLETCDEGCPFNNDAEYCRITDEEENATDVFRHFADYEGEGEVPDWCPIKQHGFVTVKFPDAFTEEIKPQKDKE